MKSTTKLPNALEKGADGNGHSRCCAADLFQMLAGKWVLPVLYELHHAEAPLRFGEVRTAVGAITTSELTKTLRLLSELGLVERVHYGVIPPRVEYFCTPLGQSLRPHLDGLANWLKENGQALARKTHSDNASEQGDPDVA